MSKIIESLANGPFPRNPALTGLWSSHQSPPTGAGHLSLPCLPVSSPGQDSCFTQGPCRTDCYCCAWRPVSNASQWMVMRFQRRGDAAAGRYVHTLTPQHLHTRLHSVLFPEAGPKRPPLSQASLPCLPPQKILEVSQPCLHLSRPSTWAPSFLPPPLDLATFNSQSAVTSSRQPSLCPTSPHFSPHQVTDHEKISSSVPSVP